MFAFRSTTLDRFRPISSALESAWFAERPHMTTATALDCHRHGREVDRVEVPERKPLRQLVDQFTELAMKRGDVGHELFVILRLKRPRWSE